MQRQQARTSLSRLRAVEGNLGQGRRFRASFSFQILAALVGVPVSLATASRRRRANEQSAGSAARQQTANLNALSRLGNLRRLKGDKRTEQPHVLPRALQQPRVQHQQVIMDSLQSATTSATTSTAGTLQNPVAPSSMQSTIPPTSSSTSEPANDDKAQEIGALLRQANAMLNKLTRLQAMQVATD